MSVPPQLEEQALRIVYHATLKWLGINAKLGYAVDPSWPAPEVLERPGWQHLRMRDETATGRIVACTGPVDVLMYEPEVRCVPTAIDEVVPIYWVDFEFSDDPDTVHGYAMGLHPPSRVIMIFHRTRRREEARHP